MSDFAVFQTEMQHLQDAAYDLLNALTDVADSHDMAPRQMLAVLSIAEVILAQAIDIALADFTDLNRAQESAAAKVLK